MQRGSAIFYKPIEVEGFDMDEVASGGDEVFVSFGESASMATIKNTKKKKKPSKTKVTSGTFSSLRAHGCPRHWMHPCTVAVLASGSL